jgi:hypothetical protein
MSDPGTRLQAGVNNRHRHLRLGFCRTILKACLRMIVIGLLIQIFPPDVSAEWKIVQWQPFQIRKALMLKPGKSESAKRRKSVTDHPVKIGDPFDVRTPHVQRFEQIWPDGQSSYLSELSAQLWGGYLWRAGTFLALLQSGMQGEALFLSDIFREAISQDNLLSHLSERAPAAIKENSSMRYFRVSFFNRDMQYRDRNISGRDAGRNSSWENFLFQSTDMRNQPVMETIGKIFEPRVDLGIEF